MKTKQKKELHTKNILELKSGLKELLNEFFNLRLQKEQKKLKNLRLLSEKRKDIAIIRTILKEKEFENLVKNK